MKCGLPWCARPALVWWIPPTWHGSSAKYLCEEHSRGIRRCEIGSFRPTFAIATHDEQGADDE